jgi:hypothetical protein
MLGQGALAVAFRGMLLAGLVAGALPMQGCAAVGLTLLGVGAGVGTDYAMDGIAYRTFTASLETVRRATLLSVKRMDITLQTDEATETGRQIVGMAGDRTIDIELQKLTSRVTRVRVTARHGVFLRDRATAGEFIAQTEQALDETPSASPKTR